MVRSCLANLMSWKLLLLINRISFVIPIVKLRLMTFRLKISKNPTNFIKKDLGVILLGILNKCSYLCFDTNLDSISDFKYDTQFQNLSSEVTKCVQSNLEKYSAGQDSRLKTSKCKLISSIRTQATLTAIIYNLITMGWEAQPVPEFSTLLLC